MMQDVSVISLPMGTQLIPSRGSPPEDVFALWVGTGERYALDGEGDWRQLGRDEEEDGTKYPYLRHRQ